MFAPSNNEVATTTDEVLPRVGERVIVQCEGFRCLGYCDQHGRWIDAYSYQVLPAVLSFKPLAGGGK